MPKKNMRPQRGQAAVLSERDFGRLWGRLKDQGWRVMAKPHWFARGDPRTWMWCAPEALDARGKLRSRDAGELGESIFLDKVELWTWAQRSGWALPADDDDDATGDREGSPSSADEPDDAAAPTSEHHYYRLCIEHHNRLDASRVEARALAAEAATVPEHVLLSPQSQEAPASAKWKENDRIEAFCRKDMTRYYPGTVHEVNVDGTYAVVFDDSAPYRYDADVLEDHIRELADAPATDEPAPAAPVTAAALPPPGTRVAVRFDDGQDYGGTITELLDEHRARVLYDDGQTEAVRFPDQDVRVLRSGDNATARAPPPPESRVEVLFDDLQGWYAGTVVGGALDEHRATVFFDADGLSQVINFAETGIRVLGTTGELGVGARVALGGKAGKVVEKGKKGWWSVRLEGEAELRSARAGKLTVLGRKILVLTAGGRVATILERNQRGWFAVELDGNVNDEGGAFERKSMRRPMFAPGQDALLDRAPESAPSQKSKRPQAGAPAERAAQRQRFER